MTKTAAAKSARAPSPSKPERAPYQPIAGSGADRVVRYLQTHPREELGRPDFFEKFKIVRSSIDAILEAPIAHGLIVKGHDFESNVVWRAGPKLGAQFPRDTPANDAAAAATPPSAALGEPLPTLKRTRMRLPPFDAAAIPLETGVPKPSAQMHRRNQMRELILRMQPGNSVLLDTQRAKHLLGQARKMARDAGEAQVWSVRMVDATHSRVWRDA